MGMETTMPAVGTSFHMLWRRRKIVRRPTRKVAHTTAAVPEPLTQGIVGSVEVAVPGMFLAQTPRPGRLAPW